MGHQTDPLRNLAKLQAAQAEAARIVQVVVPTVDPDQVAEVERVLAVYREIASRGTRRSGQSG